MPFANTVPSGPAISTPSPAPKRPCTPVTPTGSSEAAVLRQRALRPGVDVDAARSSACRSAATACRRRPAARRPRSASRPARRALPRARRRPCAPLAITDATPPALAISAATTFERMPPDPQREPRRADLELVEQPVVGHLAHELGAGQPRVARVEALLVGQQQRAAAPSAARRPGRRGRRCRRR